MPEINREWVAEQLQAAKVKIGSGKAIMKLLEAWEDIPKLSDNMTEEVFALFPKLALGHSIFQEENEDDYTWVNAQPGQIIVGDIVRVKADAYQDKLGPIHNSRRGSVAAVRYGDVIFNSTDGKSPELKGVHYSPYKLEKRVRKAQ
tara:strand:- start:9132 stop:9569 length:438 start_codon:yes stop_codon:yes gene_type:complete